MGEAIEVVGRGTELALIERWLAGVVDAPGALALVGEPGIGKSTLWRTAVEAASQRGYRVLRARPTEPESRSAFTSLGDVLDDVTGAELASLPEPQRQALDVALGRAGPLGAPIEQRLVGLALHSLVRTLARAAPVVVAIDDAQWLDTPTRWVVRYAARRLDDDDRVGVLLAQRPVTTSTLVADLEVPDSDLPVERVTLRGLTLGAIDRVVRIHLQESLARPILRRIHDASAGNALYALEIARTVVADGVRVRVGEALPVPDTLQEVIGKRVRPRSRQDARVLLAVASLAEPTVDVLERALGPTMRASIERAVGNGVLDGASGRIRFVHPLFASAIYWGAPAGDRQAVHARLAEVLEDPEQSARQLALANEGPDADVSVALAAAARSARARGAPEVAAELFEQSLRLMPDGNDERWTNSIETADCRFALGDFRGALQLLESVVEAVPAGRVRADALRLRGEIQGMAMDFRPAYVSLVEALHHVGDEEHLRAEIEQDVTFASVALGDFDGARAHIEQARARAERLGDDGLLGEVLSTQVFAAFLAGDGLDRASMHRALQLDDPARQRPLAMVPPLVWGVVLFLSGDVETARPALEDVRTCLMDRGQHASLPVVLYFLIRAELARGGVGAALDYLEESRDASANNAEDMGHFVHRQSEAELALHVGDLDRAKSLAGDLLPAMIERGWLFAIAIQLATLATVHSLRGEHADVDATVGPVVALVAAMGLKEIAHAPFLADEVEALLALGEVDRADQLTRLLAQRSHALERPVAAAVALRCEALVLAARGASDDALRALDTVAERLTALGPSLELGRTLLVKGELARRTKRWSVARSALEVAIVVFGGLGARAWAERAQAELGRVGGRAPATDALSPTERSVAELVAHGMTNREVAQKLFLSPKAVEANLTKVYRKLGVRSRAELAAGWSAG